jgi:hypothetical protein
MKGGLPFTSTVKATAGFLPWQSVGDVPDAALPAAEVRLLREGISSLADSTIDRLAPCGGMMKNPRDQTQKIYFVLKMLKGPTGFLPQPFGGNGVGHQPASPNEVDAATDLATERKSFRRLVGSEFSMSSRRGRRNLPRRMAVAYLDKLSLRQHCLSSHGRSGVTVAPIAKLRRLPKRRARTRLRVTTYLLALLSSRRLWPAPITAPLAAFPPMAPIAAPFAAPFALGWAGSFGGGCVAAGGGVELAGGGVCACDSGTIAVIAESAITIAECLIWPLLGRPPVCRCCNIFRACARRGHYLTSSLLTMIPRLSCRCS